MKKYLFFISIILLSCQEEITLNIPQAQDKIVVEGSIENGFPTYVTLRKNQGYFESIDSITISKLYIEPMGIFVDTYGTSKVNLKKLNLNYLKINNHYLVYVCN